MIKFYNAIPRCVQEENSIIKFKYKLRNSPITNAYYNIKKILEENK